MMYSNSSHKNYVMFLLSEKEKKKIENEQLNYVFHGFRTRSLDPIYRHIFPID